MTFVPSFLSVPGLPSRAGPPALALLALALEACGGDSVNTTEAVADVPDASHPSVDSDGPAGADSGSEKVTVPGDQPNTGFLPLRYILSKGAATVAPRFAVSLREDPCKTHYEGKCRVRVCPRTAGLPTTSEVPATLTSAGEISVSADVAGDGSSTPFSISLAPEPDDSYLPAGQLRRQAFLGGEAVRFHAAGGKLPGFDVTETFPFVLLLERPTMSAEGGHTKVSGLEDLTLAWTRGEPNVVLWLEAFRSPTDSSTSSFLTCRFDSTAGQGTVPKSILSALGGPASITLYTVRLRNIDHGSFRTTVAIAAEVYTPDKQHPVWLAVE